MKDFPPEKIVDAPPGPVPARCNFRLGQIVHHRLYDYRGVVIDVDPCFRLTEAWYQSNAKSNPPKEKPWYHVLVHETGHRTYVPERNLEPDASREPISHPELAQFFRGIEGGTYVPRRRSN